MKLVALILMVYTLKTFIWVILNRFPCSIHHKLNYRKQVHQISHMPWQHGKACWLNLDAP